MDLNNPNNVKKKTCKQEKKSTFSFDCAGRNIFLNIQIFEPFFLIIWKSRSGMLKTRVGRKFGFREDQLLSINSFSSWTVANWCPLACTSLVNFSHRLSIGFWSELRVGQSVTVTWFLSKPLHCRVWCTVDFDTRTVTFLEIDRTDRYWVETNLKLSVLPFICFLWSPRT